MPIKSEKQRRLMHAAASGKKTRAGVSKAAAQKMLKHGRKGKK